MDRYERILTLHRILKSVRYPVSLQRLKDELGCSRATLYRDIAFLRDALGAPIEGGEGTATFHYAEGEGQRFELPGLWLTSEELAALVALEALIEKSGPGILASALAPLRTRIERLMSDHNSGVALPVQRIRVVTSGSRRMDEAAFRAVASATLLRRQFKFRYRARSTGDTTERTVSPQRLTHYRDNWYVDAWDHERQGLRSFAVDRIAAPQLLDTPAVDRDEAELNQHLAGSYGIFSGAPKAWATLRFSAHAARWVADEHWHSQQQGSFLPDGRYELRVPYSNSRELLMDVMKYGPDAEVVSPLPLREEMKILLQLSIGAYS